MYEPDVTKSPSKSVPEQGIAVVGGRTGVPQHRSISSVPGNGDTQPSRSHPDM
jgi:hypothetical protein